MDGNEATNLSCDPPEEPLALVAVGGTGGRPEDEVVRRGGGDWVDQGLQRLFVHMELLKIGNGDYTKGECYSADTDNNLTVFTVLDFFVLQ